MDDLDDLNDLDDMACPDWLRNKAKQSACIGYFRFGFEGTRMTPLLSCSDQMALYEHGQSRVSTWGSVWTPSECWASVVGTGSGVRMEGLI